jgi:hypothetical protein
MKIRAFIGVCMMTALIFTLYQGDVFDAQEMRAVFTSPDSIRPQVSFSPLNLSFTESDWQLENGKSIKMSIYVPSHTVIIELQSKLHKPNGWDIIPNAEESRTTYVLAQDTIYAYNINNSGENDGYITDQFWIKPSASMPSAKYRLFANSSINYIYRDPIGQDHSSFANTSETINLTLIKSEKSIDWNQAILLLCTIITTFIGVYELKRRLNKGR